MIELCIGRRFCEYISIVDSSNRNSWNLSSDIALLPSWFIPLFLVIDPNSPIRLPLQFLCISHRVLDIFLMFRRVAQAGKVDGGKNFLLFKLIAICTCFEKTFLCYRGI